MKNINFRDIILGAALTALCVVSIAHGVTSIGWSLSSGALGQSVISPAVSLPFGLKMQAPSVVSLTATTTAGSLATSSVMTYNFSNVASGALATSSVPLTYYFQVTAFDTNGGQTISGNELSTGVNSASTTNEIVANWSSVPGAIYYGLYIGTSTNGEGLLATTTALTLTISTTTATSSTGISLAALPTVNTAFIDLFNPNGSSTLYNLAVGHLNGNIIISTIATGTGAGAGATTTVNYSYDTSGDVLLHTGSAAGSTTASIFCVNFGESYPKAPVCDKVNESTNTVAIASSADPYASSSASQFCLMSNGVALPTSTLFHWGYQCIN